MQNENKSHASDSKLSNDLSNNETERPGVVLAIGQQIQVKHLAKSPTESPCMQCS